MIEDFAPGPPARSARAMRASEQRKSPRPARESDW